MTGMEMMLSKLIGMTPDQMKAMATAFVQSVESIQKNIEEINAKVNYLYHAEFERQNPGAVAVKKDAA